MVSDQALNSSGSVPPPVPARGVPERPALAPSRRSCSRESTDTFQGEFSVGPLRPSTRSSLSHRRIVEAS